MITTLEEIKKRAESGIVSMNGILTDKNSSSVAKNRASYAINTLEMFLKLANDGIEEAGKTMNIYRNKAEKWDKLEAKISKFYPEDYDDNVEGDLCDIGEIAATAFGFL